MWPPKYVCIKLAFVGEYGINPKTGRKIKQHRCALCRGLFMQTELKADHIVPVVGPEGFTTWDDFIARLFTEAEGFQAICHECHDRKTGEERETRRETTKQLKL